MLTCAYLMQAAESCDVRFARTMTYIYRIEAFIKVLQGTHTLEGWWLEVLSWICFGDEKKHVLLLLWLTQNRLNTVEWNLKSDQKSKLCIYIYFSAKHLRLKRWCDSSPSLNPCRSVGTFQITAIRCTRAHVISCDSLLWRSRAIAFCNLPCLLDPKATDYRSRSNAMVTSLNQRMSTT